MTEPRPWKGTDSLTTTDFTHVGRAAALLVIFGVAWWNWREPVLRFTWQPLNYLVFLIALLLPMASLFVLRRLSNRPLRWATVAILALPTLVGTALALLVAFAVAMELIDERHALIELVRRVRTEQHEVAVYCWHGGATASSGIVVRHELAILPGIRLVKDIYHSYPATDVRLEWLPNGMAMFDERETVALRRHVWF